MVGRGFSHKPSSIYMSTVNVAIVMASKHRSYSSGKYFCDLYVDFLPLWVRAFRLFS